jgi:nucleotide-binding universal stress UspA family protein
MYQRILVPVDGSRTATCGLREAIRLAKGHDTTLRLLHVIDRLPLLQGMEPPVIIEELLRSAERAGHAVLEAGAALAAKHSVQAQTIMRKPPRGRVADTILDEARKWKAGLIVMGTHGRRGVRHLLLGSDAESVVRAARAPVLLVRSAAAASGRARQR